MVIFKIGDADRPAGPKDIKDMEKLIRKVGKDGVLVCHHAVDVMIIPDEAFRKHKKQKGKK